MRADHTGEAARASVEKRKQAAPVPFEFCKVCNLNHNQGRRHRYFPNHIRALSRFLSRFEDKLSDIRFFLKNPSPLRPEHATLNRLWCVFCDVDICEVGSVFVCNNAIHHLANSEHLKSVKRFLRVHGGEMKHADSCSVSEMDLSKWEKKCEALKVAAPILCDKDTSKDIHNELSYVNKDTTLDNTMHFFKHTVSLGVVPLQSPTNEVQPLSVSSRISNLTDTSHMNHLLFPMESREDANWQNGQSSGGKMYGHAHLQKGCCSNSVKNHVCFSSDGVLDKRRGPEGKFGTGHELNAANGASPPWLEENENFDVIPSTYFSTQSRKSQKLNPKRVGAAWAEKRKAELEMEKRGQFVVHAYDANWLPNFGRVWQEGTRKETRKEFEMEKKQASNAVMQPEASVKLQPYISKRMKIVEGDNGA